MLKRYGDMDFIMSLPFEDSAELVNHAICEENNKINLINWLIGGYAFKGVSFDAYKELLETGRNAQGADEILENVRNILDGVPL